MTLYLTEATDPDDVAAAAADGLVTAVKLYPAGRHHQLGERRATSIRKVMPVLERMAAIGLPLCVHGEVTDADGRHLRPRGGLPRPGAGAAPRRAARAAHRPRARHHRRGRRTSSRRRRNLAATLTVHHLILNRNHLLVGGIRPHYYCLPIVKRERHRLALLRGRDRRRPALLPRHRQRAARRGTPRRPPAAAPASSPRRWRWPASRTSSRPKARSTGSRPSPACNGPAFYGLPPNEARLTLERCRRPGRRPRRRIATGAGPVVVFDPGFPLHWRVVD